MVEALRACEGWLYSKHRSEATFTIPNLGMFGVERLAATIVPPEAGILEVGPSSPGQWWWTIR